MVATIPPATIATNFCVPFPDPFPVKKIYGQNDQPNIFF